MQLSNIGNIEILQFDLLKNFHQISHFISTRKGGVSVAPYESLNLGFRNGDVHNNVLMNRKLIFRTLGISTANCVFASQVHSSNVAIVSGEDGGKGVSSYKTGIPDSDALITDTKNLYLVVLLADCAPVLFFDTYNEVIGIAHSGRMGVVHEVVKATITTMQEAFNSDIKNIIVGIGPTISGRNYLINQEKVDMLKASLDEHTASIKKINGLYQFDLSTAISEQLISLGVSQKNIEKTNLCTYDRKELFFSERRDSAPTGRFMAAIALTH